MPKVRSLPGVPGVLVPVVHSVRGVHQGRRVALTLLCKRSRVEMADSAWLSARDDDARLRYHPGRNASGMTVTVGGVVPVLIPTTSNRHSTSPTFCLTR